MVIFIQPDELGSNELANDKTTLTEKHQYNGASPSLVTQLHSPHSPLTDTAVALNKPPPRPFVEAVDAACLARDTDLPEVRLQLANNMIFWVYQDWVHQNPGNHMDGGSTEDGKCKYRWENLFICLPNATMHCLEILGENLSQPSQWSSTAYDIGNGNPSG